MMYGLGINVAGVKFVENIFVSKNIFDYNCSFIEYL